MRHGLTLTHKRECLFKWSGFGEHQDICLLQIDSRFSYRLFALRPRHL